MPDRYQTLPPLARLIASIDAEQVGRILMDAGFSLSPVNYEAMRDSIRASAHTCICGDRGTHRPEPGIGCTRPGCLCLEPAEPLARAGRPPNPGRRVLA